MTLVHMMKKTIMRSHSPNEDTVTWDEKSLPVTYRFVTIDQGYGVVSAPSLYWRGVQSRMSR